MEFEHFLYIIILFVITLSYVGASIASQISDNSTGKNDPTSSLINSLKTGNIAGAFNSILSSIAGKTVKTALVPVLDNMSGLITRSSAVFVDTVKDMPSCKQPVYQDLVNRFRQAGEQLRWALNGSCETWDDIEQPRLYGQRPSF